MTDLEGVKPQAIFEFTDTTFIEMVWFVAFHVTGPQSNDWLAVLYKDEPGAPWRLTTRMRLSDGGDAFSPADTKDSFDVVARDGSAAAAADYTRRVNLIYDALRADPQHRGRRVLIRGDVDRFVRLMRKEKWFHGRIVLGGPERPQ